MPPTDTIDAPLGTKIRNARLLAGMRQWDLARALGVTQASVSRWEAGKAIPDLPVRPTLAGLLDLPEVLTA